MKDSEKLAVGCAVVIGTIVVCLLVMSLEVAILSGLSMLVCNVILPVFEFDKSYAITFWQGCGVGVIFIVARMCLFAGARRSK